MPWPWVFSWRRISMAWQAVSSSSAENKVLAHPASVDSIPSSANQEDIVSMGTTAGRKAGMIVQNTFSVLADELLTACQAIDIRRQLQRRWRSRSRRYPGCRRG